MSLREISLINDSFSECLKEVFDLTSVLIEKIQALLFIILRNSERLRADNRSLEDTIKDIDDTSLKSLEEFKYYFVDLYYLCDDIGAVKEKTLMKELIKRFKFD